MFHMGLKTLKVPMKLHKDNRTKILKRFATPDVPKGSIMLFKGGDSKPIDDSDIEYNFKQESYFQYLFGVKEPDCMAAIEIDTGKATLFISRMPEYLQPVLGKIEPPSFYRDMYQLDDCRFVDEVAAFVKSLDPEVIYLMSGVNTDSGLPVASATFPGIEAHRVDKGKLQHELACSRMIKSDAEIEVMRYITGITAEAHKEVMRQVRPGMMEYQAESIFLHYCYFNGGARFVGYGPIAASGPNTAVLHYGHAGKPNDRQMQDGDLMLLDCGAEYHGYDGDLTSTFPVNGKFTPEQREIYETVLITQKTVEAAMKAGVAWPDMHRLANRTICEQLKKHGFLKGEVEDMEKVHIAALFMPHGLGHLIGLDTHDVAGYLRGTPKRIDAPGIKKLRTARILEAGMVITVEPGVYFNSFLLEPAFANPEQAKFLVEEKIRKFWTFGGVRIEDDVVIRENGIDILDELPRTCDEIEKFMAEARKTH